MGFMRCVQGHTPCNYILNLLGSSRQAHISEKKINSIGECRNRIAFSIRLLNLMSLVCHTHNVGCIRELWNNLASGEVRWIKKKKCPWLLNPSVPVFGPIMLQFAEGCFWQLCDISSLEQHKYISAKTMWECFIYFLFLIRIFAKMMLGKEPAWK